MPLVKFGSNICQIEVKLRSSDDIISDKYAERQRYRKAYARTREGRAREREEVKMKKGEGIGKEQRDRGIERREERSRYGGEKG